MKTKTNFLDKVLCLLSVIAVLLLVGVITNPNNETVLSDKKYTSTVVKNNHLNSVSRINGYDYYDYSNYWNYDYEIEFDSNGGTLIAAQYVKYGDYAVEPEEPTRNGYEFVGWYLDNTRYNFNKIVTDDITLVARWTNGQNNYWDNIYNDNYWNEEYEVKFDSNGGTYVYSQYVEYGDYAEEPVEPTRYGYEFAGWYLNNTRYYFNKKVTDDITLVARWTKKVVSNYDRVYTIEFDSAGGSYVDTQYVEYGDYAEKPETPTRKGYYFGGWYGDNGLFNFNAPITKNQTLEAHWVKLSNSSSGNYDDYYNNSNQYYKYCKKETQTQYSITYVEEDFGTRSYNWTIKFENVNSNDLEISDISYLKTSTNYFKAYEKSGNGDLSMVDGNEDYYVSFGSGTNLQQTSLKSNNFTKYLSKPYQKDGDWYVDATVSVRNYYNVTPFYARNLNKNVYFVPFMFKISYTDLENCEIDLASRQYYYDDYEIVDSFYY